MAGRFLKQWRKYRQLTLEQVAERLAFLDDPGVPTTAASISRLEAGKQGYTERSLEALASIYECEASDLIGMDPFERDELDEAMRQFSRANDFNRARAARILQALAADAAGENEAPEVKVP